MTRGIWLGFLFFVALVILGFGTLLVGDLNPFRATYDLTVNFPSVQGLREGDDVRVDGVLRGKVHRLDLDPRTGVQVTVRLEGPPVPIYQNAEILVDRSSPLGG